MAALQHHSHTVTWERSQQGSWERSQLAWSEHYTIYNAASLYEKDKFSLKMALQAGTPFILAEY